MANLKRLSLKKAASNSCNAHVLGDEVMLVTRWGSDEMGLVTIVTVVTT